MYVNTYVDVIVISIYHGIFHILIIICHFYILIYTATFIHHHVATGADPGFFKGGVSSQGNGYIYKLYYIHIAIIHIIISKEVHCNLLKAIDA